MAWIYLMMAVGCEIVWASSLKATDGYSQLLPSIFNASVLTINIYFLSRAVQTLPVAIAYPIWTGLGGAGVAIVAVLFFHESLGIWQIVCILAIVLGVIGLEVDKPQEAEESINLEEEAERIKLNSSGEEIKLALGSVKSKAADTEEVMITKKSE